MNIIIYHVLGMRCFSITSTHIAIAVVLIFTLQEEDDWCEAKIIRCRTVAVPHTTLEQKTFDVSFKVKRLRGSNKAPTGDEPETDVYSIDKEEVGVKSDRIRMIQKAVAAATPAVVESTGILFTCSVYPRHIMKR